MGIKRKSSIKSVTPVSGSGNVEVQWDDAPFEFTSRSTIVTDYGDTGTGRTTWALTAPGPIALIHSAEKIDGIVQRFAHKIGPNMDGKRGMHCFAGTFTGNQDTIAAQAMEKWRNLKAAYIDAYSWARTVIVDTETDLYALLRFAYFGSLKPVSGRIERNWEPVNAEWATILGVAHGAKSVNKANTIFISETVDEWTKPKQGQGSRTGRTIRAGKDKTGTKSDVIVRTYSDITTREYWSVVEKAWMNSEMLGEEFEGDISTFPMIMGMVTDTDPVEWGME